VHFALDIRHSIACDPIYPTRLIANLKLLMEVNHTHIVFGLEEYAGHKTNTFAWQCIAAKTNALDEDNGVVTQYAHNGPCTEMDADHKTHKDPDLFLAWGSSIPSEFLLAAPTATALDLRSLSGNVRTSHALSCFVVHMPRAVLVAILRHEYIQIQI
tara:strand:- start:17708 stop:18178 length:471 start_codon:yes stop_codon:yes gene_type:complete